MAVLKQLGAGALGALVLAGCDRPTERPPAPPAAVASTEAPPPQFVCDGVNAPRIVVAEAADAQGTFLLRTYDKAAGAPVSSERRVRWGEGDAGMGSVNQPLLLVEGGAEIGSARWINEGMIEDPSSAYTKLLREVRIDGDTLECRWLERTRVAGFTSQRSFVISEDADGDLIYRSFDFSNPGVAQAIELGAVQRTTPFNVEVRGGQEVNEGGAVTYAFENAGVTYRVHVGPDATVTVLRGGETLQTAEMVAYQTPPVSE